MEAATTDWVKIWAIFGPFIGVLLGFVFQMYQQRFTLKHSDRTRFHELRVDVYSKFLTELNYVFLDTLKGEIKDIRTLILFSSRLSLIGSESIRDHTYKLVQIVTQARENINDAREYRADYEEHLKYFYSAARNQLLA